MVDGGGGIRRGSTTQAAGYEFSCTRSSIALPRKIADAIALWSIAGRGFRGRGSRSRTLGSVRALRGIDLGQSVCPGEDEDADGSVAVRLTGDDAVEGEPECAHERADVGEKGGSCLTNRSSSMSCRRGIGRSARGDVV
jgi:hypothetical protein